MRKLTVEEYAILITDIMDRSVSEWEELYADRTQPGIRSTVAGICLRAHKNQCGLTLETLMARVVGRVRDATPTGETEGLEKGRAVLEEIRKVINDPRNERT